MITCLEDTHIIQRYDEDHDAAGRFGSRWIGGWRTRCIWSAHRHEEARYRDRRRHRGALHSAPPLVSPKRSTNALRVWELRLSITKWIVSASGYLPAMLLRNSANSGDERFGVTFVK